MNITTNMTLSKEDTLDNSYAEIMAEEIQKEIDESILADLLVLGGWTKVPFYYINAKQAIDIIDWCVENFDVSNWKRVSGSFVFRNKKDAEWFILRWS